MPILSLNTNLPKAKISDKLLQQLSAIVASELKKPELEAFVAIEVTADMHMSFGGNNKPCAVFSLQNIGGISKDQNINYSAKLMTAVHKALDIPMDRMYMTFTDMSPVNWGYNGSILAVLAPHLLTQAPQK